MPAKLEMKKMPLSIIRPLCLIEERYIRRWAELRNYEKQIKQCPYETVSHRSDIRNIFSNLERINPEARYSIWNALESDMKLIEKATE